MEDIIKLLQSDFVNIAKISKYTQLEAEKLKRIFYIKEKDILKDDKTLSTILEYLSKFIIGRDFVTAAANINQKINSLNTLAKKVIINPSLIPVNFHSKSNPQVIHEISHLLSAFDAKLTEMIGFFEEEQKVLKELETIKSLAEKKTLTHIKRYIETVEQELQITIASQNKTITSSLMHYIQTAKVHEEPYTRQGSEIGRLYFSDQQNGKAIIIYAGTTIHFKQYEPLSYRLALEGFFVLALNLPGHGYDLPYRMGIGSQILSEAVRVMRTKSQKVGVIGFSMGALCCLYNLFSFDYRFEVALNKELRDYAILLKKGRILEVKQYYPRIKALVHQSILRTFQAYQKEGIGLVASRSSGIPDAIIFAGMPVSLIKSKKLICPTIVSLSYGWMRFWTNTLFNDPQHLVLQKVINGLEQHNPVQEPLYQNKESIYLKFFQISSKEEFHALKKYLNDLNNDPQNLLLLLTTNEGQYINYLLQRVRSIPKLFMYGEKDAIASGGYFKELFSRMFTRSKNLSSSSLQFMTETLSPPGSIKLYEGLGHTFDERSGFFKKLSRRPQTIIVQNDMINFMKASL